MDPLEVVSMEALLMLLAKMMVLHSTPLFINYVSQTLIHHNSIKELLSSSLSRLPPLLVVKNDLP